MVSKWCGSVGEAYRTNPSKANKDTIMQLAHELYQNKVGKRSDFMHWWLLLKDVPKWETLCDEGVEVASKRLRVNEIGVYSDSPYPGTPSTSGTPSTLITPGMKIHQMKKGVGYFAQSVEKLRKRRLRRKYRIHIWR